MIKVLECFAGIGACSKALDRLGIDHEIVDAVEIDRYAIKSFNAVHGTSFEPQDITKWDKSIECDLIMHGSPCTSFSMAGKQEGGDEGSGTPSSLMYETLRIVGKLRPKYVVWENVKNLLSKKHRHNFDEYLRRMEALGYENHYRVLNAKDFGIPQNRERVFTVSICGGGQYEFPKGKELKKTLSDILEKQVDKKYFYSDDQVATLLRVNQESQLQVCDDTYKCRGPICHNNYFPTLTSEHAARLKLVGTLEFLGGHESIKRVYSADGICPTITTMGGGHREPKVEIKKKKL